MSRASADEIHTSISDPHFLLKTMNVHVEKNFGSILSFTPLTMYSSPFFSALVLIPATSEPAPGSVTQYPCMHSIMKTEYPRNQTDTYTHQWFFNQSTEKSFLLLIIASNNNRCHLKNRISRFISRHQTYSK